jgi:hypothetical protein
MWFQPSSVIPEVWCSPVERASGHHTFAVGGLRLSRGRVVRPGGTYLSQGVGAGSTRELYEALMGRQPHVDLPSADRAADDAQRVGLEVVDVRQEATRVEFFDIAAVVHFLRKVVCTVPDFTVARYRRQLADLDEHIRREGASVSRSLRYLLEARKVA